MKAPIEVTVDPECGVAYVRYLDKNAPFDGSLPLFRDPDGVVRDRPFCEVDYRWDGVHIDVTPDDDVMGIEILSADDPMMVTLARDYAADNGLAFPADIRAAASAGDPAA